MQYSKLRKGVRSTPRKVRSLGKVYYKKNYDKLFYICSRFA